MDRRLVDCSIVVLAVVLAAGCSRDQGKPAATASPAAVTAATPGPQAAKPTGEEPAEELYVDVEAEPDEGAPPLTVKFTASVEDAAPPLTYKWDFGDESAPATDATPTHVYQKEGEYTASVIIKDSKGTSGSEEIDILVEAE